MDLEDVYSVLDPLFKLKINAVPMFPMKYI